VLGLLTGTPQMQADLVVRGANGRLMLMVEVKRYRS
jgi:hypothetical protein